MSISVYLTIIHREADEGESGEINIYRRFTDN